MHSPTQYFDAAIRKAANSANWESVEKFAEWYAAFGFPFAGIAGFEVFVSDDAVAFPMFRHGQYQVELYILENATEVRQHSHPFVEVVQTTVNTQIPELGFWSALTPPLIYPTEHGGANGLGFASGVATTKCVMLTFEKWDEHVPVSTLAAAWKGKTAGPLQEALIRRFFPSAYIENGYADVTRSKYAA